MMNHQSVFTHPALLHHNEGSIEGVRNPTYESEPEGDDDVPIADRNTPVAVVTDENSDVEEQEYDLVESHSPVYRAPATNDPGDEYPRRSTRSSVPPDLSVILANVGGNDAGADDNEDDDDDVFHSAGFDSSRLRGSPEIRRRSAGETSIDREGVAHPNEYYLIDANDEGDSPDTSEHQEPEKKTTRFAEDIELQDIGNEKPRTGVRWMDDDEDMPVEAPTRRIGSQRSIISERSDVSEPESVGWDVGIEVPLEVNETTIRNLTLCFEISLTWLLILALFLLVLATSIIHLATILLMAAQVGRENATFTCSEASPLTCIPIVESNKSMMTCLGTEPDYNATYRELCGAGDAPWVWALLLVTVVPELFVIGRCFFYWIRAKDDDLMVLKVYERYKIVRRRQKRAFLAVLTAELLHALGVSLLLYLVLPLLNSAVHMVAIMSCTAIFPAFVNLRRVDEESRAIRKAVVYALNILALIVQLSGLFIWPILIGADMMNRSVHLVWSIPLTLVLVSIHHIFNYLSHVDPLEKKVNYGRMSQLCMDIRKYKNGIYLIVSPIKIVVYFLFMMAFSALLYGDLRAFHLLYSSCPGNSLTLTELPSLAYDWAWVLLINVCAGFVCYVSAKTAARICAQVFGYGLPVMLAPLVLFIFFLASCDAFRSDRCYFAQMMPAHFAFSCARTQSWYEQFASDWAWLMLIWWLSKLWIARHMWQRSAIKLAKSENIFFAPLYDGVFLENSLMMNRMIKIVPFTYSTDSVPMIKICATMWHETKSEMSSLLRSICRLDIDQAQRQYVQDVLEIKDPDFYNFEAHIFFDDAVEIFNIGMEKLGIIEGDFDSTGKRVNGYVQDLIQAVNISSQNYPEEAPLSGPEKFKTPYGARLVWTLPGGNQLIVHLKDKSLVKRKKRWSQVLYMYYFLGYELHVKQKLTQEQRQDKADNTFFLTLDGDVDFEPRAVILLLDRMRRDNIVGSVCGRIHPQGSGPIVWYQKFEYALGHWLQKATEHVMGSVLCCPGCFSLFRASALMDRNVMKTFTTESSQARHFIQFDQGEDRWLCTLLLKQGWHVEYCAASNASTQAPNGFEEFFNQRRRWTPSTMSNILDILSFWRIIVQRNEHISLAYMIYQTSIFVMSLLGSGIIFLMITDALSTAFHVILDNTGWLIINAILVGTFTLSCFIASPKKQVYLAMALTLIYVVVQSVVLIALIVSMVRDGTCSETFIFFMFVTCVFFLGGILHPKEFFCLPFGLLYFFLVPCMYMLLMIYSLCNLHVVSWGVREDPHSSVKQLRAKTEAERSEQETRRTSAFRKFIDPSGRNQNGLAAKMRDCIRLSCCSQASDEDLRDIVIEQQQLKAQLQQSNALLVKLCEKLDLNSHKQQVPILVEEENADILEDRQEEQVETVDSGDSSQVKDTITTEITGETKDTASENDSYTDTEQTIARPDFWLEDSRYMPEGVTQSLPDEEETFFKELIDTCLLPRVETPEYKLQHLNDLKSLRDKVSLSYLLLNIIFIIIIYTLKQFDAKIDWFCGQKIGPVGFVFIVFFGIILVIQTLGMCLHRLSTVVQIVANTRLGGDKDRQGRQAVHELFGAVESGPAFYQPEKASRSSEELRREHQEALMPRRRNTVVENALYMKQRKQVVKRGLRLKDIMSRRVYQADKAMDPRKRRKSVLFRQSERYRRLTSAKFVLNGSGIETMP